MKTFVPKDPGTDRKWYVIDATGLPVGRLGVKIANVLRGKEKPIFSHHVDTGDFVVEFKSDEQKFDILIYDMQGVVVFKKENISCKDDCRATVELTSLRQGIYLIKAMTYNSVRTSKIILK